MLGQQEPGIWSSRATDVHSPLSRSPRCAGLNGPHFSQQAYVLRSPHFTAAKVEAQESRPHGPHGSTASGSSGQPKCFYADKRAEAGSWLVGLGFLCLVLLNGLCRETWRQPGSAGVPARTHQWLLQGPWTDSCCRRLQDSSTSLPRRALMSWPWRPSVKRKNICVTSLDFQQPVLKGQCPGRPATKL